MLVYQRVIGRSIAAILAILFCPPSSLIVFLCLKKSAGSSRFLHKSCHASNEGRGFWAFCVRSVGCYEASKVLSQVSTKRCKNHKNHKNHHPSFTSNIINIYQHKIYLMNRTPLILPPAKTAPPNMSCQAACPEVAISARTSPDNTKKQPWRYSESIPKVVSTRITDLWDYIGYIFSQHITAITYHWGFTAGLLYLRFVLISQSLQVPWWPGLETAGVR